MTLDQGAAGAPRDLSRRNVQELLELIPAPVTAIRPDGTSGLANQPYLDLFGISEADLHDRELIDVLHPEDLETAWTLIRSSEADVACGPIELRVRHADDTYVNCTWMLRFDSASQHLIATAMDARQAHAVQRQLITEARTDDLTGVSNRAGLLICLEDSIRNDAHRYLAVVDLDRFKAINDTFGHAIGDEVLKVVAQRLQATAPVGTVVSRIGGDEFVLVISEPTVAPNQLGPLLVGVGSEPIVLGPRRVAISVSVGVAASRGPASTTDLLHEADVAVYEAKKQKNGASWAFADAELVARRRHEIDLEHRMRTARGTGQFQPWFQPIVDVQKERTVAYESLMRWVHPQGTIVPAYEFVELASDVGLIASIGREVVEQTLALVSALPDTNVAINLSPAELADERWLEHVLSEIDVYGISRDRIEFEVTETSVIRDLMTARRRLQHLADQGFSISLDDFGSGYSSLTYLTTLPIQAVKLDRALISNRRKSSEARRTFDAIVRFVQELGHTMVVEGVETLEDHEHIASLDVRLAQGWFYGKAMPAKDLYEAANRPTVRPMTF